MVRDEFRGASKGAGENLEIMKENKKKIVI